MRALALSLLIAACASRREPAPPEPAPAPADAPVDAPAVELPPPSGPSASATADELEVTVTIDAATYTAKANTIRCITTPCPSNAEPAVVRASVAVRNVGDAPQDLRFTSTQRIDLAVVDDEGEIVRTWSADKLFGMMMGTVTLAPGESEAWTDEIVVAGAEGELAGSFVLRGWVVGHGPTVEVPFEVELEGQ